MQFPWARGRSIVHDFENLPPALEPDALEQAVLAHDAEALIAGHMRLALQVAAIYFARDDHQREDIIGAAMLGLVYAVDRWPSVKRNNNITPYIVTTVHSKVRDFLDDDDLVRIPGRTRRAKKKVPEHSYINDYDPPTQEEAMTPELREALLMVCHTPTERKIIELRMQRYRDPEIGRLIGYSGSYVTMIRGQIKARFVELWNR